MSRIAGKSVTLKGIVRAIDDKLMTPKILVKSLKIDGEESDKGYTWLEMTKWLRGVKVGDVVTLRAINTTYLGLEGDKQVVKNGFICCRLITKKV